MTATDELRAMLDERGVEWESGTRYYVTQWSDCERHFTAVEQDSKLYVQYSIGPLTPAQAIAATIERGTCYDVGEYPAFRCSECGGWTFVQTGNCYALIDSGGNVFESPTYCPLCGRKVVEE